jgi:hypothetical protein
LSNNINPVAVEFSEPGFEIERIGFGDLESPVVRDVTKITKFLIIWPLYKVEEQYGAFRHGSLQQ